MPNAKYIWQSAGGQATAKLEHERAIARYLANPTICRQCLRAIPLDGRKPSEVRRKVFCNHHCSAAYNNAHRTNSVANHCTVCDKKIAKDARFCRDHRQSGVVEQLSTSTKGELFARCRGYQSARSIIRKHAAEAYRKAGHNYKCIHCGYDKHVQISHIRAVSDFPDTATIAEINALSNLMALCPNCHWEFDHGILILS